MGRNVFLDPAQNEISCGSYLGKEPSQSGFNILRPECALPATLAGIYHFAYLFAGKRHKLPFPRENSLFIFSLWVYSCDQHLPAYLPIVPLKFEVLTSPEIIVDAQLDLEEKVFQELIPAVTGKPVPDNYFTEKRFYNGTENLRELWRRERCQFQF